MIKVLVLICVANQPCDINTAIDVIRAHPAKSIFDCIQSGQATVAATAIKPRDGEFLKLVCTLPRVAVNVPGNAAISTEWHR